MEVKRQIETVLEKYVAPHLAQHGGNLYLEEIRDDIAYIKFTGQCSGCPSAKYTLATTVKEELLKHTDAVKDVKLAEGVSDELYNFAKDVLQHRVKL